MVQTLKENAKEIAEMLASLFEYAISYKAIIVGHPLFYITKRALRRQRERMRQAMPT
jgi:hypothetical protein